VAFVYVLQHHAEETAGTLGDVLRERGIEARTVHGYAGEPVPRSLGDAAGMVILGGPMGGPDRHRYPFLDDEIALIGDALAQNAPVLGICLGGQLLAHALGASVGKAPRPEIGWFPLRLTEAARQDRLWAALPSPCPAFHWHEDAFALPPGAALLASSALTPCQAFRSGASAYGLQCHLEVTDALIETWLRVWADELPAGAADAILSQARQELPGMERAARAVFGAWADIVAPLTHGVSPPRSRELPC